MVRKLLICLLFFPVFASAQISTDRVMAIGRNALYFEDYVLSIQYFNQVINSKPYLYEPYFYRALAKINLDDFQGAEEDCNEAIERNPFIVNAYQIRGLARIRQSNYEGAIEDYEKALHYYPENIQVWHNLVLCRIQQKDYEKAAENIDRLLAVSPRYTRAYMMRGEVNLQQKDTIQALADFDKAIELDKYDSDTWAARGMVRLQKGDYAEAESDLDQAIQLNTKGVNNYINRALARFHQNNLLGAMSDYNIALDIEPYNFIGHYNRGLLRAQVGDDNRALEDFDFVLQVEPDNMMATFNRAILRDQVGDYQGAIQDYTTVINKYPNFMAGYHHRAQARRKTGDTKGADADDFKVLQMQLERQNRASAVNNRDIAEVPEDGKEGEDDAKTRKQSDKNIRNYRKIMVADTNEEKDHYKNTYRGRVQDKNVDIRIEPLYVLTYYEKEDPVRRVVNYHKSIDDMNREGLFSHRLIITNMETPLTEKQVEFHFNSIDARTTEIVANPQEAKNYFMRGLDFYLVQDLGSSMEDFTEAIRCDETFFPAYFMRALVRYKQLEYERAEGVISTGVTTPSLSGIMVPKPEVPVLNYDAVKSDLDQVIQLAPDFVYAYYNRGNVLAQLNDYRSALVDYNKAIELHKDFAEAYFNRGLTHVYLGNNRLGISDLSKAGELGIVSAYNVIKRFTGQSE